MRGVLVYVVLFVSAGALFFVFSPEPPDNQRVQADNHFGEQFELQTHTLTIERADGRVESFQFPSRPYLSATSDTLYVSYDFLWQGELAHADGFPIKLNPGDRIVGVTPDTGESTEGLPSPAPPSWEPNTLSEDSR